MLRISLLWCVLLSVVLAWSQSEVLSIVSDSIVRVKTNTGSYHLSAYGENVIAVDYYPNEAGHHLESFALIAEMGRFDKVEEDDEKLLLQNGLLTCVIQKASFSLNFESPNEHLFSQKPFGLSKDDSVKIALNISSEDVLYGGGARAVGMNRRGHRLELYNKAHYGYEEYSDWMNYTLPLVFSSKRYFVHFDNPTKGILDLDHEKVDTVRFEAESGAHRYQVAYAQNWDDLLHDFTLVFGRQPLPPMWVLGNFSSRFGYRSAEEVRNVVQLYEQMNIPVDALILDLYWFGKTIQGTMGNLRFDIDSFPNPTGLLQELQAKKIQPILITEPFILSTSDRWEEALAADVLAKDADGKPYLFDFYFGNTGLIDIFSPKAKAWFWDIYKELREMGAIGVWGDLGEPEVHPAGIMHHGGRTANELHNVYGHEWARLVYEGYANDFPEERLFNLMRAGATGSQRYGLVPWSGDVNRTWGGLKSQVEIALQMGMQGLAYMHSDLGGFAGDYDDPELYVRWLQYGVFQPVFRPHAQEEVPSEPVFKDAETRAIAANAIQLRYQLLPYNYALVYENSLKGRPLMRPLFFDFPIDSLAQITNSSFLWGKSFLITPVVEKSLSVVEIVVPPHSIWVDFYSGELIQNLTAKSKLIAKPINENQIPTLVKSGSIIPFHQPMQRTSEYDLAKIDWLIFLDNAIASCDATIYFDNGLPMSHINFQVDEYNLRYQWRSNTLLLEFTKNGMPSDELTIEKLKFKGKIAPKKIKINGKKVTKQ